MESKRVLQWFDVVVTVLLLIGGLNWGLIGFFGIDIIAAIFGELAFVSRLIYALVGICALYELVQWREMPRR